jgi:hypothetical protein
LRKKVDAKSFRGKINELMKSKEAMMDQDLEEKDEVGQKEARR